MRMPLSLIYFYDERNELYKEVGTHRTITIAQYEELERKRYKELEYEMKASLMAIGVAVLCAIILGVIYL